MRSIDNILCIPGVMRIMSTAESKIKDLIGLDVKVSITYKEVFTPKQIAEADLLKRVLYQHTHIDWQLMTAKIREPNFVEARQYYAWIYVKVLNRKSIDCARVFFMNHTSIVDYIKKIRAEKDKNSLKWRKLEAIINDFEYRLKHLS